MNRVLTLALLMTTAPGAQAMLFDAWSKALTHDANYQFALAEPDIRREDQVQARSQLLPQINAQGSRGKADAKISSTGAAGAVQNRNYDANLWTLQIRQPLLRPAALYAYRSSNLRVAASTFQLQDARQTLLASLLETLARLQLAEASLSAARTAAQAAEQRLVFMQRQLRAGNASRRDTADAMNALAQARQQLAEAALERASQMAGWAEITGDREVMLPPLPTDLAQRLPLIEESLEVLVEQARLQQPAIRAAAEERDAVALDVQRARSEHLPSLDLNASRSFSESNTENTLDTTFLTNRVDLQVTLPLFSGGATQARVRQTQARLRQAEARLDGTVAKTETRLASAIAGLTSAREQAASANQALESADVALRSATLGIEAGTATLADKINAEISQAVAARDRARANAVALLYWSQLQQARGQLDEGQLRLLMDVLGWKEPANQAISFGR